MMLRKNASSPMENCCNLYQDIVLVSKVFQNFVSVMAPAFTSSQRTSQGETVMLASMITTIGKGMMARVRHHTSKTLPHLQRCVEMLLVSKLSVKVQSIADNTLSKKSFKVGKGQTDVEMGAVMKEQILKPSLLCFKTYCTSNACVERLMTATMSACVDSLFAHIKEKRYPFNEAGVFVLHAQVDCLLQWVRGSKAELGYAPSVPIILDLTPWHKASGVMHILLAATGGVLPKVPRSGSEQSLSVSGTDKQVRLLTIFEQERWAELGEPRKWSLGSMCSGKSAKISISPVLDTRDL
jgi:hypothetical protein